MNTSSGRNYVIGPFNQIVTLSGLSLKGPLPDDQLQIISNGGVIINDGIIEKIGNFEDLRSFYSHLPVELISGPAVLLPSMVDCHTHICYAGSRAQDYNLKLQGFSYVDIAKQGGGIWRTVLSTRDADEQTLTEGILARVERHLNQGVTTIEIKSGYGLSGPHELKMLRAIHSASSQSKASLVPTFLGAHTVPHDFDGSPKDYLYYLSTMVLPLIAKEKLCNRVDIFIEETAFGEPEAEQYLEHAKKYGFDLTVHADQFTAGGSEVAVKLGALSADHLEASGDREIEMLSKSNTVAVVLPGASLGLGIGFAPARQLLDAGCCLAIASDWNPGSAPMGDILLQAAVMGMYEKLSAAETFSGLTFRAAAALGLHDRGKIEVGYKAHLMAFPTSDYREILYHQGSMKPFNVWC
ncbi:MAG: imidazolonepropionase [Chitinophagaceae bacterium]|nr:imidazolonepropionase [Chitinophagaceae bacterium]